MEHIIGGAHLQHTHAEPISFGIDQILNNVEQSCMLGARMHEQPDYGYGGCVVSAAYGGMNGGFTCSNNGYNNMNHMNNNNNNSCGMGSLGGTYNMNMGVSLNGSNVNGAGVIRVPAHRPMGSGHASLQNGGMMSGAINNLTGLTFPWMESNRRYTKDRFTGRSCVMLCVMDTWNAK